MKNGWRMKEIVETDVPGLPRPRACGVSGGQEKKRPRQRFIDADMLPFEDTEKEKLYLRREH